MPNEDGSFGNILSHFTCLVVFSRGCSPPEAPLSPLVRLTPYAASFLQPLVRALLRTAHQ